MPRLRTKLPALLVLAAWAALGVQAARAQVAVVTVQSVDALIGDTKYGLTLIGQENQAKTIDGLIASLGQGGKGLAGLDMKRPLGVYVNLPKEVGAPPIGVIFVPITKDSEFLDLLTRLGAKHEKQGKVYKLSFPGQDKDGFVTFANNYAYGSDNAANLEGKLIDPATIIPASHKSSLIAATGRLDQVPAEYKQMLISQVDQKLAEEKEKKSGENDVEFQIRQQGAKAARDVAVMVIEQSKEVTLSVQVDQKQNNLALDLSLAAKPGSQLAGTFKTFGAGRSMFSGWVKDSAFNFLGHLPVAGEFQANFLKLADQGFKEGLKNAKSQKERELAEKLYNAVLPTLKSEALDLASVLHGPMSDGKYVGIAGLKVKEGKSLEKTLLELLKEVPDKDLKAVKMSTEKLGDQTVHFLQPQEVDEEIKRGFGNSDVRIVFLDNAILVTLGTHGKDGMTKALAALKSAGDGATSPVQIEASLARLAPLAKEDQEQFREAAKKIFTGDLKNRDRVRLSLQGGDALRLRFDVNAEVLKLITELVPLPGG